MPAITHLNDIWEYIYLSDIWEYIITIILNHCPKSELGIMIREWVKFNKLEDVNSLLNLTVEDFSSSGNPCYYKDNGEMLPNTPLKELYNLRWYTQNLIDESGYDYDD